MIMTDLLDSGPVPWIEVDEPPGHHRFQLTHVEWLVHDVAGPEMTGAFDDFRGTKGGHQNHRCQRRDLADLKKQGEVLHIRQPVVEQHDIDRGDDRCSSRSAAAPFSASSTV